MANPLQYSCLENPLTEEPGGLHPWGRTRLSSQAQHSTADRLRKAQCLARGHRAQEGGADSFSALAVATGMRDWPPGTSPAPTEQKGARCAVGPSQPLHLHL